MHWTVEEALDWIIDLRFSREEPMRDVLVEANFDQGISELLLALKMGQLVSEGELEFGGKRSPPSPMPANTWRDVTTDYPKTGQKCLSIAERDGAVLSTTDYKWTNITVPKDDVVALWPSTRRPLAEVENNPAKTRIEAVPAPPMKHEQNFSDLETEISLSDKPNSAPVVDQSERPRLANEAPKRPEVEQKTFRNSLRPRQKELAFAQLYLEMISSFQAALRASETALLIIGFGFNDNHLAEPILAAIETNLSLKVVVISPDIEDQSDTNAHLKKIAGLIDRGDARLAMLAGSFEDLVPIIPDIAAQTDLERHIERVQAIRGR